MPAIVLAVTAVNVPAQTPGESDVVLPLEAQTCNLPVAPVSVPENATYEQLAEGKGRVVTFQGQMQTYRQCLDAAAQSDALTDGNRVALTNAHNYSVEMEQRVAEQFNVAVRAYKARQSEN
jgi:hypothetical protein